MSSNFEKYFSKPVFDAFKKHITLKQVPAGYILLKRGCKIKNIYSVREGIVSENILDSMGRTIRINFYQKGDCFGMGSVIDLKSKALCDFQAVTLVTIEIISSEKIKSAGGYTKEYFCIVINKLLQGHRRMVKGIYYHSACNVLCRTATWLYFMSKNSCDNTVRIQYKILSQIVATSRESLCRTISQLVELKALTKISKKPIFQISPSIIEKYIVADKKMMF